MGDLTLCGKAALFMITSSGTGLYCLPHVPLTCQCSATLREPSPLLATARFKKNAEIGRFLRRSSFEAPPFDHSSAMCVATRRRTALTVVYQTLG